MVQMSLLLRAPKITHRIAQKVLRSSLPETDADPRLLRRPDVVAEDLDGVDEAELLALELLHDERLLLVIEVAVERVALPHGRPQVGQAVRVQVF